MTTRRSLVFVHGRDHKPNSDTYSDISLAAMRAGLERDFPDCVNRFDEISKQLVWYGDIAAEVLQGRGRHYDEATDVADRRKALATLRTITPRKKFSIRQYDQLPGKSALPEFFASCIAPLFGSIGLLRPMLRLCAPDVARYLDPKSDFAMRARTRLRDQLIDTLQRGERVMLVAHGSGSLVAYDVLWQLSHDPDYQQQMSVQQVDVLLTLGSPLGDANIRKRLLGAKRKSIAQFPVNVVEWHNVAAEDDYTCHDNTLADDFKKMMQERIVSAVHDYKIYNLAVRYGRSNPHSSVGYYIHPRVAKIIADWLQDGGVAEEPKYTL